MIRDRMTVPKRVAGPRNGGCSAMPCAISSFAFFLAVVNACVSPHVWWVLWIVAGWGVSLLLEGIDYLCFTNNECHERSKTQ